MKLSCGASGFVISRPAIPLAAVLTMSGVDIYLFLVLFFFVCDVYVAVNMEGNVKYESLSVSIGVEMTDINFYASPSPRHVQHSNPQHKQTRPQWLMPFSAIAIAARDNLVPVWRRVTGYG